MYFYLAIFLAGLTFGGTSAWKVQTWRHDSAQLAAQVNQRATERLRRQNTNTAATSHEADKIVIRKVFVPVREEVERVIQTIEYRDRECFSDAGLRVIQSAIARANGDTAKPSDSLPKPAKPQ